MPLPSPPPLERARPLLGTLVRVRVAGCSNDHALEASSRAFESIARVHRLMSFHEAGSELSELNRSAHRRPVAISTDTLAVLGAALDVAHRSAGAFDPTVAAATVRAGALPPPEGAPPPEPHADWRDVELDAARGTVRFRRPLWLDLGGIAKGYAVDVASDVLRSGGVPQSCIDAGGDLRVFGPDVETVALDPGPGARHVARAVRIRNGSIASSGQAGASRPARRTTALHFDPPRRRRTAGLFVSVQAEQCMLADALTKVVLARGRAAGGLLARFGARAAICSPTLSWSVCGVGGS